MNRLHGKPRTAYIIRWVTVIIAAAALIGWFFYPLRSYIVMGVYSAQHSRESVMQRHGFSVDIPAGQGWYPFVLTYNAEGFAAWSGVDADMSILYNFGAFDAGTRTSSIYDTDSDKYCAFYGAYVLHVDEGVFGFDDDSAADMDEIARAVEYDYTQLVLAGFGCDEPVFRVEECRLRTGAQAAGTGGWTRVDAAIAASGVAHNFIENRTAYLQYGPPAQPAAEDFAVTALYGRLYLKYFMEYGCTVMLYVIAPDIDTVDACDAGLLAKASVTELQQ